MIRVIVEQMSSRLARPAITPQNQISTAGRSGRHSLKHLVEEGLPRRFDPLDGESIGDVCGKL